MVIRYIMSKLKSGTTGIKNEKNKAIQAYFTKKRKIEKIPEIREANKKIRKV